ESTVCAVFYDLLQLSLHSSRKPDGPQGHSLVAGRVSGERISQMLRPARHRWPFVYVRGQAQWSAHVLRESLDQKGPDRISRGLGCVWHRVQFSRLAQLGFDVAGYL